MPRSHTAGAGRTSDVDSKMTRLGPKLRAVRQERGLTLDALASEAELTKGFLSLVERGQTAVSVPNLLRICAILGVSVGALFDFPDSAMVRSGQGAPLEMGGSGIREYLLTPATERHVQVMRTVLQPGGGSGGAYTLDSKTIVAVVVRGRLRLTVDGQDMTLGAGDCYTFSAQSPHAWENADSGESEVIWSIAPPLPTGSPGRS
ncbi:XRE family transcriptional regulator [Mycolicibacterium sp. 120266]|uniref:helix-turn-helix domain-containing protein n=1 Tax=Mycolicibacterium sp. 120266 TaxID=3090601 RepID=UPI00299E4A74|nr:XRE family transcriptional regulator [Mycolicibacterium sp. 120266]MDX1874174.1 XRE family transcriptional regulator [Mycolicibacterium sp. 120266]